MRECTGQGGACGVPVADPHTRCPACADWPWCECRRRRYAPDRATACSACSTSMTFTRGSARPARRAGFRAMGQVRMSWDDDTTSTWTDSGSCAHRLGSCRRSGDAAPRQGGRAWEVTVCPWRRLTRWDPDQGLAPDWNVAPTNDVWSGLERIERDIDEVTRQLQPGLGWLAVSEPKRSSPSPDTALLQSPGEVGYPCSGCRLTRASW